MDWEATRADQTETWANQQFAQYQDAQAQVEKLRHTLPDLEALRDRILTELRVGKQSAQYKRTKAVLERFIKEVREDSATNASTPTLPDLEALADDLPSQEPRRTASELLAVALAGNVRNNIQTYFEALRGVAESLGYKLYKRLERIPTTYYIRSGSVDLFESAKLDGIAAWLGRQPLPD